MMLVGALSEEEFKNAVWSCDNSKSPGLDGFNFGFIKFCWDCLKEDILALCMTSQLVENGLGGLMRLL